MIQLPPGIKPNLFHFQPSGPSDFLKKKFKFPSPLSDKKSQSKETDSSNSNRKEGGERKP